MLDHGMEYFLKLAIRSLSFSRRPLAALDGQGMEHSHQAPHPQIRSLCSCQGSWKEMVRNGRGRYNLFKTVIGKYLIFNSTYTRNSWWPGSARIRWRKLRRSPYPLLIAAFGGQGYIPYASLATISGALQRGVGRGTGDREEWKWKTGREKDRTGQFTQNHCWQNLDFQLKMHPDPLEAPPCPL